MVFQIRLHTLPQSDVMAKLSRLKLGGNLQKNFEEICKPQKIIQRRNV